MIAEPLHPKESDERPHPIETTPLWNESWYFDFADAQQGIGGWIRLGLMPNEEVAWICGLVSGPGMPTVAVLDFEAALPADPAVVHTDKIDLRLECLEPLKKYRVSLRGRGRAHQDAATLLRSDPGDVDEMDLAMELVWATAGVPYLYRLTPRYEIPCTVSGTVRYGNCTIELDDVAGQRDHSWGVRDWWGGLQWMWCALHLDDGRHLHVVDARLAGLPNTVIGYIQQPDTGVVELEATGVDEAFSDGGLPISSTIRLEPGGLDVVAKIGGHAPVRLVSTNGQVSHFPRAWVTVTTSDGGTGVGWIEWNRLP